MTTITAVLIRYSTIAPNSAPVYNSVANATPDAIADVARAFGATDITFPFAPRHVIESVAAEMDAEFIGDSVRLTPDTDVAELSRSVIIRSS